MTPKPRPTATPKTGTRNGWKTCSRGHKYRGPRCPVCWPGGAKK